MANATKKASGLTLTREGMKFVCSWKITDEDFDGGQQFRWRTNLTASGKWEWEAGIERKDTSRNIWLSSSNYYPNTAKQLSKVTFQVRGKRKSVTKDGKTTEYNWSEWAQADFNVNEPSAPSVRQALDDELDNVCKFSWETETSTTNSHPTVNAELQTILVRASNQTDGSKLKWAAGQPGWYTSSYGANSSATFTENSIDLANDSYTRWVRVRTRGPRGATAWKYQKHVYAKPYVPKINYVSHSYSNGITTVYVDFTADANAAHPIDRNVVQYTICTPGWGQAVPVDASWTDAVVTRDTGGKDGVKFTIEGGPGTDQVLFVRMYAEHDRNRTYSPAKVVRRGSLAAPSIESIETGISSGVCRVSIEVAHNSDVPDSRIAVICRLANNEKTDVVIGDLGHSTTEAVLNCPVWDGSTEVRFCIYEYQGTAEQNTKSAGSYSYYNYKITANMKSASVWQNGYVPMEPSNVKAVASGRKGEVKVTWSWTWWKANSAEVSWSDNPNGWESTVEPQSYMRKSTHVAGLYISGLETGKKWYFRVRLASEQPNGDMTYSPYSDTVECDLSESPDAPMLLLSAPVVKKEDTFTASWNYVSADGTAQNYAEIREATVNGDIVTVGSKIASVKTAQSMMIAASRWNTGTTHYLVLRVSSESGLFSGYSDPVPITVADPITCTIAQTSLVDIGLSIQEENELTYPFHDSHKTINGIEFTDDNGVITANGEATGGAYFGISYFDDEVTLPAGQYILTGCPEGGGENSYYIYIGKSNTGGSPGTEIGKETGDGVVFTAEEGYSYQILIMIKQGVVAEDLIFEPKIRAAETKLGIAEMPFTATIVGAGAGGTTTLIIERTAEYHMIRPDDTEYDGYDGETIVLIRQDGEAEISVGVDDLIGRLDDGAQYRLIAETRDGYGQTATESIEFGVHWTHQAEIPTAVAEIEDNAAKITATAPEHAAEGDVCDIYRLSVDAPELIVENGIFGETYVDPYPAIGPAGGHRVVHKTVNGDYITEDNHPAWVDLGEADGDILDVDYAIINFGGEQIMINYNMTMDNAWEKDFQRTAYLGGAVQGDWNPGVSRSGSVSAVIVTDDQDVMQSIRRLAEYAGICHVRTQDGSSYAADIQVSDGLSYEKAGKVLEYSLTISRVDTEGFDGMTLDQWEEEPVGET